jgi:hypothetical protein
MACVVSPSAEIIRRLGHVSSRTRRTMVIVLAAFSATVTLSGLVTLTAFDAAPGQALTAPALWPVASGLGRRTDQAELLVFVHPFCSCTNATITELAKFMTMRRVEDAAPVITFVVFRPAKNSSWRWDSLKARTAAVPGSRLVWDDQGIEARRFGAATSGDVLLYSSAGVLSFHGGVTGARGHEGDNYGLSELLTSWKTSGPAPAHSPTRVSHVFGCSIRGRHEL